MQLFFKFVIFSLKLGMDDVIYYYVKISEGE